LEWSKFTDTYADKHTERSNIILGYTAFYRANNQTGYMMMSLGDVNIIKESQKKVNNQLDAQKWLINNMKAE